MEKVEEIKLALECCANWNGQSSCNDCPIGAKKCFENGNLISQLALTLINELESENERLSKEKEDLRLFDIALGKGKVDMTLGGNTAKSFINAIVQIFEQNNATNFLATTIETISSGNKYSLVIQKENGQTPSEKLTELKDRITELEAYIKCNEQVAKAFVNGWNKDLKNELKQFAERVKMEFYYQFDELIPSIMADKIDEILNEFE